MRDRDPEDEGRRTSGLPDAVIRLWPAGLFVFLAVAFTGWYVWLQPPGSETATNDVVIRVLQLVPSLCAILVPAALLARHPDAPDRARTLATGTILFAVVQGLVVLASPLQPIFVTVTPPSIDLGGVVALQALYGVLVTAVTALALSLMARGLVDVRQYEDRAPGWLTGWLVPSVTIFGATAGVLAAAGHFGGLPMTLSLAIYLAVTACLGVVRLVVWAYLLAVTVRGSMAGEEPTGAWVLAMLGAAAVLVSLVVLNVTSAVDLPSADVANIVSYSIVISYAVGNVLLLLAFVLGMPAMPDDAWDDAPQTVSRR